MPSDTPWAMASQQLSHDVGLAVWGSAYDAMSMRHQAPQTILRAAAFDAASIAQRDIEFTMVAHVLDCPDPWEPLLKIFALGYWPLGYDESQWIVCETPIEEILWDNGELRR